MLPSPSGSNLSLTQTFSVDITEGSQIGETRRRVETLVDSLGFDKTQAGKAALVTVELASNLVKHARNGELIVRCLERNGTTGIELLAVDQGPGILDVFQCLRDGYSTVSSPGTGLGAVTRLAASFDIYSFIPSGTAVLARIWSSQRPPPALGQLTVGAVSLPRSGENICGDAWDIVRDDRRELYLVADGLGHGPLAAEASREAVRSFRENSRQEPAQIIQIMHDVLRSTRGAAVAVAALDLSDRILRYAGVGNISGSILAAGASRSLVSYNGTVGHAIHKIQEFVYPFPNKAFLILHSDGLTSRWNLNSYQGLTIHDPALVAGVLYRDFKRGRDDATVLVVREKDEDGSPS